MENYKVRVNNEAESREAQELFFELGGCWATCGRSYNDMVELGSYVFLTGSSMLIYGLGVGKEEITIPQLRDLAVLKRNNVGDANAYCNDNSEHYYISSDGKYFYYLEGYESSKWMHSSNHISYLEKHVKPIEKPVKEYLNRLADGTYKLVVLSDVINGHDGLIEIPEGSNIAVIEDSKVKFYSKYISANLDYLGKYLIWMRPSIPEELSLIDDKPLKVIDSESSKDGNSVTHTVSLNDQYAEIEQVRQESQAWANRPVGRCLTVPIDEASLPDFLIEDTVNHPSHYAGEIECIDAIESSMTHEAFCGYLKGNVQKYMWRYENKGGLESLEKAQWYLNKLISRIG